MNNEWQHVSRAIAEEWFCRGTAEEINQITLASYDWPERKWVLDAEARYQWKVHDCKNGVFPDAIEAVVRCRKALYLRLQKYWDEVILPQRDAAAVKAWQAMAKGAGES